ncbi:ABC transporter ATP-binding protein [Stappia taiwanensis]|uniref:ABC transporter ATP-binding protein n=2 Tax=Stappia taiwanensis TaxID=992267 RepID=A0A838XL82_9HYPH|nr:ABC transporter ATP-binding protein [Stappia taiwanensis]MBA4610882.1 ABC transporter ATP-binding protein [Stappia taiwanensis]
MSGVRKVILDGLSLDLPGDKNIAILGQNGAGKSTLMRLIAGAELPDAGRIMRYAKVSWPLGFGGGFNGTMSGVENARFVARMYGEDPDEVISYVEEFSELGPSMRLPIKTYSSGMRARLAFGVSMAIEFKYYLIDEITAVGDARFKKKCNEVFEEKLKDSNILMISHSNEMLRRYCQSGCVLHQGHLYYYEDISDAIDMHNHLQNQ